MNYLYSTLEKPTRLYIKKCPHCDLKYFGKSVSLDIEKYQGGGTKWRSHLKEHNVKSIHLWNSDWYYDTSIIRFALKFSYINNIVKSKNWANSIPENGINGGGDCHQMHNEEARKKASITCMERYGVDHPLKSSEIRNRANKTVLERYGKSKGQLFSSEKSIDKRNSTNLLLYGNKCAANRNGNKKSIETQKFLHDREIVKILKCILPFSEYKPGKNWWLRDDMILENILKEALDKIRVPEYRTKRDLLLIRKPVRLIIMINKFIPLSLGQNWFQKDDIFINDLFNDIKSSYPNILDIALRSYHLIFPE